MDKIDMRQLNLSYHLKASAIDARQRKLLEEIKVGLQSPPNLDIPCEKKVSTTAKQNKSSISTEALARCSALLFE